MLDVVEIDSVPLEEHSVVVSRTWWQWFLRKKTQYGPGNMSGGGWGQRSLMLFVAWYSTRMGWTLGCPGEGGFWRCQLTSHCFLTWLGWVPSSAPDSLFCLGCRSCPSLMTSCACLLSSSPSVVFLLLLPSCLLYSQTPQPNTPAKHPNSLAVADMPWLSWPWLCLSPFPISLCWSSCQVPEPHLG